VKVKDILVPAATEDKSIGLHFAEEMYVVIYEVTTTKDDTTVPIYCTYLTDSSDSAIPKELPNVYAKFPTKSGVLQLLQSLNMTDIAKNVDMDSIGDSDPFLPKELVFLILTSPLFKRMSCSNRNLFDETTEGKKLTDNELSAKRSTIFHECYRRLKQVFQKEHNIRFAFLGGSHRTATAVHFFGGYDVKPNKNLQKNSSIQCYKISDNMKINASPSCTIIIPKEKMFDESFIKQCNTYSYNLEKSKTESIKVGFASLSLNILDEKKHKDIEPSERFFKKEVFQGESVSFIFISFNQWNFAICW
jgi:hypothetical protein